MQMCHSISRRLVVAMKKNLIIVIDKLPDGFTAIGING